MQVGSRIWILWGIVNLVPGICSLSSVPLGKAGGVAFAFNYTTLLYAWSITEVIRYFFYGIKVCESHNSQPKYVFWVPDELQLSNNQLLCRNAFEVLPIGQSQSVVHSDNDV